MTRQIWARQIWARQVFSAPSHDNVTIAGRTPVDRSGRSFARKQASVLWRRMLRLRATPHEVALGCAAGVFAACTPFLGLQIALAMAIAFVLRVNVPAAVLGTFVGNPLSWPAIWSASYFAGAWVLGTEPAVAADHLAAQATRLSAQLLAPVPMALDTTAVNLSPFVAPMVLGGLMIGLLAAAGSYYPMRRAVRVFQKRRRTG